VQHQEIIWEDDDGEQHISTVYPTNEDEEGFHWADAIPELITKAGHGTTFIMLGDDSSADTMDGDSDRDESIRYLSRKYYNTRFWELPDDLTLEVIEFDKPNVRVEWPKSIGDRSAYQYRGVKGARDVAHYVRRSGEETLQASGTVDLPDGTKAHWFLRKEPNVNAGGVGANSAFIAVKYRNELYGHAYANQEDGDTRIGANVYRQFGIGNDIVRKRVFIILEPPEYDELFGKAGVAPSTGRADLYWLGAGASPRSVKPSDWAQEFAEWMPDEIEAAIAELHEQMAGSDEGRAERLKKVWDRFAKRWKAARARVTTSDADTTTQPTSPGSEPRQQREPIDSPTPRHKGKRRVSTRRGRAGGTIIGMPGAGDTPAKATSVTVGLPDYEWVTAEDINDGGMIAAWQEPSKKYANGCVMIDKGHPVILGQVEYWQGQYPKSVAMQVGDIVREAYAEVAVAKAAHLHALNGTVLSDDRVREMLLNPALTTSLLGLISEDALISPRMGKIGTKRKRDEAESAHDEPAA